MKTPPNQLFVHKMTNRFNDICDMEFIDKEQYFILETQRTVMKKWLTFGNFFFSEMF